MVDERILQRRRDVRAERKQRRLRRTFGLLALVVLLAVALMIERSSLVALAEVRVDGTQRLSDSEVREAAALQLGTSTLRLRLGRAEERVEALPLVAEATVRRLDPLTVQIDVVEREPAMNVRAGSRELLLDADGVALVEDFESGLPLIELPPATPLPTLGQMPSPDTALGNAIALHAELPGPLRAEIQRYEAGAPDAVTAILRNGIEVLFGRADRVDEKARALGAVLEDLAGESVSTIDVRAPRAPVVIP